ncbi:hypothetical protein GY45DRAFT_1336199 [Cubamyces sp. BRFM 1775]|nr:hypothetical protein GY45DRAFT_1336199 [Cubamyces sp. BRFM 1775]
MRGALPPLTATTTAVERILLLKARKLLTVMRKPRGGWPERQPLTPFDLEKVAKKSGDVARWKEAGEDERAVFEVMGVDASDVNIHHIRKDLNDMFALVTGIPRMVINIPLRNTSTPGNELDATQWLVRGLNSDAKRILIEQGTWATPSVTLFFTPTLNVMPTYLLTIDGFRTQNRAAVSDGIRHAMCSDSHLLSPLMEALAGGGERNGDLYQKAIGFISKVSIEVQQNQDGQTLRAILKADPPTFDVALWKNWRNALCAVRYQVLNGVVGVPCPPVRCSLCHGAGHDAGACEYPRLEGWIGALSPQPRRKPRTEGGDTAPKQRRRNAGQQKEDWVVAGQQGGQTTPALAAGVEQPTTGEPQPGRLSGHGEGWPNSAWQQAPVTQAKQYYAATSTYGHAHGMSEPYLTMEAPQPTPGNQWAAAEYLRLGGGQAPYTAPHNPQATTYKPQKRDGDEWGGSREQYPHGRWTGEGSWN